MKLGTFIVLEELNEHLMSKGISVTVMMGSSRQCLFLL